MRHCSKHLRRNDREAQITTSKPRPPAGAPALASAPAPAPAPANAEPLLLSTTQISTYKGDALQTRASGFFFERDGRLFLVTARHVVSDPANKHEPDRISFMVHTDPARLSLFAVVSVPLYQDKVAAWRHGSDGGGEVDVAVLEIARDLLPAHPAIACFGPDSLLRDLDSVEVGTPLLLVGYPLGFHDTVYNLPVVRHAIVASAFGVRFQGQGYFLTDGRAHRGSSGGPVVMRSTAVTGGMHWKLLGVHSSRMDMQTRDAAQDESLGLNCAWYADMLMALTARR